MEGTPIQELRDQNYSNFNNYPQQQSINQPIMPSGAPMMDMNPGAPMSSMVSQEPSMQDIMMQQQQEQMMMQQQALYEQQQQSSMDDLVQDINTNLSSPATEASTDSSEKDTGENEGFISFIPEALQEPLLILLIYVILSQPIVIKTFGQYIKHLNPDESCHVPLLGIIIYGIILATFYILAKKLILQRN